MGIHSCVCSAALVNSLGYTMADTNQNDPLSPENLRAGNTYGGAVRDRIANYSQRLAEALLNRGTDRDATAAGQAYKIHVAEAQANGQQPLSPQQFAMQQRAQ